MIFDVFDRLMDILNARNKSFSLTKKYFFPLNSFCQVAKIHCCGCIYAETAKILKIAHLRIDTNPRKMLTANFIPVKNYLP